MSVEYDVWWPLHIRFAQGEALTSEEQETLNVAYRQADEEERAQFSRVALNQTRESQNHIAALSEEKRLLARREELDSEIARLEQHTSYPRCSI